MAVKTKRNMFNEATRVQMPAMVHLTRIGYSFWENNRKYGRNSI